MNFYNSFRDQYLLKILTRRKCQQNFPTRDINEGLETLGNSISECHYDLGSNSTFEAWYKRYEGFSEDAQKVTDAVKVRLLLRKFQPPVNNCSSSRCFSFWHWFLHFSQIRRGIDESNISCLQINDRNGAEVQPNTEGSSHDIWTPSHFSEQS